MRSGQSRRLPDTLLLADWISLKVDAVIETNWRQVNRPHRHLSLSSILTGMLTFSGRFYGELVTETMLVSGKNDSETAIQNLASYLQELQPLNPISPFRIAHRQNHG